jgi:ABC-2 type transport system permease protein
MSTLASPVDELEHTTVGSLMQAVSDTKVIMWRNLKRIPRIPELAIFAIIQSVVFVLLFAFVFGGAIPLPGGGSYREYMLPGLFIQTIAFGSVTTTVGITEDLHKGLIDRFRSLPMARSAVLSGRTLSDLVYNTGIVAVLMLTGLAVGWRINNGFGDFLLACAFMLAFVYVMSWMGVYFGTIVPTVEAAQQVGFIWIFPLTFISSAFVPIQSMPGWLQGFAEWNPISTLSSTLRDLFGNPNPYPVDAFPGQHPMLVSVMWIVIVLAVFAPLAIRRYRSIAN